MEWMLFGSVALNSTAQPPPATLQPTHLLGVVLECSEMLGGIRVKVAGPTVTLGCLSRSGRTSESDSF